MSGFDFTFLTFSYAVAEYFTTIGIDFPLYAAYQPMLFFFFYYDLSLRGESLFPFSSSGASTAREEVHTTSRVRPRHSSIQFVFLSQFVFAFKNLDQHLHLLRHENLVSRRAVNAFGLRRLSYTAGPRLFRQWQCRVLKVSAENAQGGISRLCCTR